MARIPDEQIERLKQDVSLQRLAEGDGGDTQTPRCGPNRAVPVPRRPRSQPGHQPEDQPLALFGRLPGRRLGDRLGDESRGRQLPPCAGVTAGRLCAVHFSRRVRAGEKDHNPKAADHPGDKPGVSLSN